MAVLYVWLKPKMTCSQQLLIAGTQTTGYGPRWKNGPNCGQH